MFTKIFQALSRRNKPAPPPGKTVDDFRAHKRAEGLTDAEISAVLVASRTQTEAALIAQGRSDWEIDGMNWGRLLLHPLPASPTRDWIEYPSDWRTIQSRLRREGYPDYLIDGVLQGVAAARRHAAQPASFWSSGPRPEAPGSRAKSLARLLKQGYTEDEARKIFDARLNTGSRLGVSRYPDLEEAPFVALIAEHRGQALRRPARPRLVVSNPTPGQR